MLLHLTLIKYNYTSNKIDGAPGSLRSNIKWFTLYYECKLNILRQGMLSPL
uniref:Uncharacterized protein n=1 Tax=Aegilops tauschii subsp. strangulata TaxID=200361 RepID=A0A453MGQ0_AEGTS